ncbi:MAG: cytochrome c oxidase subunit 1 [Acidimicrobiales bacterium]|nr:MAG: cytochrome c oxidase subunit 1 [Acidimicrobiales bacterium]
MAVTHIETVPEVVTPDGEDGHRHYRLPPAASTADGGPVGLIASNDHKATGRLFLVGSLIALVGTFVLQAALDVERVDQSRFGLFGVDTYFQFLSLHQVSAVLLGVLPLTVGVAMIVVPLQVGARTVAFPRAASLSFWGWLAGSVIVLASYAANGGPGGGDAEGVELFLAGLVLAVASLILALVCLATTVVALRAEGMTLERVPFFAWAVLCSAVGWLLTLPALAAIATLALVDLQQGRQLFDSQALWSALHWFFRQPQVLLLTVPVWGVLLDVAGGTSGARARLRWISQGAIALSAALSLGAFTLHLYGGIGEVSSGSLYDSWAFVVWGVLAPLPMIVLCGAGLDVLMRGSRRFTPPLAVASVSALAALSAAVLSAAVALEPLELAGTRVAEGVASLAVAATTAAALAGIAWWAPKITGRLLPAGGVVLLAALVVVGVIALGIDRVVSGVLDEPDTVAAVGATEGSFDGNMFGIAESMSDAVEGLAAVGAIGSMALALAVVLGGGATLAVSLTSGPAADANPWSAYTLEWLAPSPPPEGNFDQLPEIVSPEPALDERERHGGGEA